ncbi:hypothetical protein VTN00DRAFT_4342 [Thermoascus crustaceus]|uniref:uncharacterized protein n=1 Tax=Thermoascus crustaceus TaxID=5088 RepID=UPI0037439BBD
MGLQDLPTEILAQCVVYLDHFPDLAASRLAFKRLAEIIAPMLLHHVKVRISQTSLNRLEGLSQNLTIAKSIEAVEIDLSFYDALVAKDFSVYARCRNYNVFWRTEMYERWAFWGCSSEEEQNQVGRELDKGRQIEEEWDALHNGDCDMDNLTPSQRILQDAHLDYLCLYDDQELAKKDNLHVSRLHRYHAEMTPPVQLIPDIFSALERSSTFPREVDFSISARNNLTVLEISSEQLHRINHVLHRVKAESWKAEGDLEEEVAQYLRREREDNPMAKFLVDKLNLKFPDMARSQKDSMLLQLPGELRNQIYMCLFTSTRLSFGERSISRIERKTFKPAPNSLFFVLFSFENPEDMLDKLSALPPATLSQICHVRVGGRPLMLTPIGDEDDVYYRLAWALKYGNGWRELHFITPNSKFLGFAKVDMLMADPYWRRPQPSTWKDILLQRDGVDSGASVTIYRSTQSDDPGAVISSRTCQLFEQKISSPENLQRTRWPPYMPEDIREWAHGLTWAEIRRQCIDFLDEDEDEDEDADLDFIKEDKEAEVDRCNEVDEYEWNLVN